MDTMTKDTTYNGWANYPTWAVNLWLSNDEGLYREALELTRNTVRSVNDSHQESPTYRFEVAGALERWVDEDLAPDLGASFAADLLSYALASVDWFEIADAWLEQVSED